MPTFRHAAASAAVLGISAIGITLAGAGTASAAPTYIGPVYFETTPTGIFLPSECQQAVAAERADGNIVLVDCIPAFATFDDRGQLRVGIDVNGS